MNLSDEQLKELKTFADFGFKVWCWQANLAKQFQGAENADPEIFKQSYYEEVE